MKVPYRYCFISTIALWLISIAVIVAIVLIDHFVEMKKYPNTETVTVTVNFLWVENLIRLTVVMFPILLTHFILLRKAMRKKVIIISDAVVMGIVVSIFMIIALNGQMSSIQEVIIQCVGIVIVMAISALFSWVALKLISYPNKITLYDVSDKNRSMVKKIVWSFMGCMIVLTVVFHQYLYFRIMSFGDSVIAYGTERDQTLLKYIEKNRKKDGEEYWPVYDHVMIQSIAVAPKQDFLFYMTYSDNKISGLSACVLQDNLGNWFVSDSTLGQKFSKWRGDKCTYSFGGEEKCESRKYSQSEIHAYLQGIMEETPLEIMRARCDFKNN